MNIGGKKISNGWLIGGGIGLVATFLLYRHFSSGSASSSTSSSSSAIDPVTGLPYSQDNQVDPATGLTYLAEATEYGSVQAAEEQITSGSAYYGQPGTGGISDAGYPTLYPPQGSPPGPGAYSNNAAWAQAVTSGLAGLGYDSGTVSQALGAFFAQMPLTSSQASIIQAAEAEYGPPPQGTYSIIPEPSSSTPPPGQTTTPTPPTPVTGLHVTNVTASSVSLAWGAHPGIGGGNGYYVINYSKFNPLQVGPVLTSDTNSAVVSGLKSKTAYTFYVQGATGGSTYASSSQLTPEVSITATTT